MVVLQQEDPVVAAFQLRELGKQRRACNAHYPADTEVRWSGYGIINGSLRDYIPRINLVCL